MKAVNVDEFCLKVEEYRAHLKDKEKEVRTLEEMSRLVGMMQCLDDMKAIIYSCQVSDLCVKGTPTAELSKCADPENVLMHRDICHYLNNLYEMKNRDYGDSFHKTYLEEGMAMARIRLTDKLERFKKLTREGGQAVKDESIRDTLIDLANYAIMTVMEMDREMLE